MLTTLSEIIEIKNGKNQKAVEVEDGPYPIYGSGGVIGRSTEYLCPPNTVVIGRKGSINNPIFVEEPFWNVDTAFGLVANKDYLLPKYLYYFCKHFDFESLNTTVTIPSLTKANINRIGINLPSLASQKRTVEVLDKICHVIDRYNYELDYLDKLIKSRFVELFGDPLQGTHKWPFQTIGEVAKSVDPQPSHRTPPVDENGIPYVSIKDCDYATGIIDFNGARKVGKKVLEEHRERYRIKEGDMIIGKIGTIGNPIFLPARDDYTLSANIVLIQPIRENVSPYFLKYSLMSPFVERQFDEAKNSTSQAAFGIQKVRNIIVMNPDIKIQNDFELFAKRIDKSKSVIQKALDETQLLFDSLMQEYFG